MMQDSIKPKAVTIIGMGEEGCLGLTSRAVNVVAKAQVLVGTERYLVFFSQFEGKKIIIKGKLSGILDEIYQLSAENNVVVLASGDPFFYGIGSLIVKKIGINFVDIIPHPGSIQTAFSRIGIKWNDAKVISLHGRPLAGFMTKIQNYNKIGLFTDSQSTPKVIAQYMLSYQETGWEAYVCEYLGGTEEKVKKFSIIELAEAEDIADLNVLILIRDTTSFTPSATIRFMHEDEFSKRMPRKGLITKKEIRLLVLGYMNLRSDSIVWDIGAASGSVAIEAAKLCPEGFVYAIETDQESVEICKENLITHKVDNVNVIHGKAPDALEGIASPDAVFVGGSKGNMCAIIDKSLESLSLGGRLVITAITLETVQETYQHFKKIGKKAEVIMVNISRAVPLAKYHRYDALSPIHIFCVTKD